MNSRSIVFYLAVSLVFAGSALFVLSLRLTPYKDEKAFSDHYARIGDGQSREYNQLRDAMLTPKYRLEDYGGTLIALGLGTFWIYKAKRSLLTPRSRLAVVAVAAVAPFVTVSAVVFDLLQSFQRGEFPHWADSIAIPLMGVPIELVILMVWAFAHLSFIGSRFSPSVPIASAFSRKANVWLLLMSALTSVLIIAAVLFGQYWFALPGCLWVYFYLSLAACRLRSKGFQVAIALNDN